MKISIVIRCFNEAEHIGRLLEGVYQQTVTDAEVIVVDSGSTDGTMSIVAKYPAKTASIRPEDFSFGRSLNIGCTEATGDVIVVASAHVYPMYKDWLERMVAPFSDPQVAVTYGGQRGDETTKFSERQVLAKWFPDKPNLHQDGPFCNNANAAIRRSVWEQLRYDESLTGLEDIECAKRAMDLGYSVSYAGDAKVVHVHNESPRRIYNRYRREAIALKRIFPQERFSAWDFFRLSSANILNDYRQAWRDSAFWKNLPGIFTFRLMQFWGTYRGFAQKGPVTSQLKRTFYYPNRGPSLDTVAQEAESSPRVEYAENLEEQPTEKQN